MKALLGGLRSKEIKGVGCLGFAVGAAAPDQNVTVQTTYTPDGQVATLTAVNPTTTNQVTTYFYGTTLPASGVARNDLLVAEIYPSTAPTPDQVVYTYNRQGQVVTKIDQNGTVHTYSYDGLGRPLADAVTALGTGIDDAVRQIARSYTTQGQVQYISSYYAASGGNTVVNQVQFKYNAFGQLITEYQEHGGEVGTSTPSVGYSYADGSWGTIRPTGVVYPNGRTLNYGYGVVNGADDLLDRVRFLDDGSDGQMLAEYSYLGAGTIVRAIYPEPCLRGGVYQGRGTDPYTGLDQFGRVVDLAWLDCTTGQAVVRIGHGYDRAGNRLWRTDPVARAAGEHFDELYAYDGVNQLKSLQRGRLNTNGTALGTNSKNFAQHWTLDATGNWTEFQENDTGSDTWSLSQTRTQNAANEITAFSSSPGAVWAQPAYDSAGNMTSLPQPAAPTASCTCTYDAWNRLVKVVDASAGQTVALYQYDGRGFRAVKQTFADGQLTDTRHYYYNSAWQLLEERVGASSDVARQHVWGLRYIDDIVLRDRDRVSERLYYIQDANWNVTALLDPAANPRERYAYDAYGAVTVYNGTWNTVLSASAYANETLYTGRQLDTATGLYHSRARLRLAMGRVHVAGPERGYYQKGDLDKAIADFDEAIKLNPALALAYYGRGLARCRKSEFQKAISDLSEAIRLSPRLTKAYNDRGASYYRIAERI